LISPVYFSTLDTTSGKIGATAASFDGTVSKYITLPNNIVSSLGNFTFTFWSKLTNSSDRYIFSAANTSVDNYLLFGPEASSFRVLINNSSYVFSVTSTLSKWYNWSLVREGTLLSLYRDGVFISSQSCVNTVLTVTGAIILGQEQDSVGGGFSASQAFQGGLNDLRLYDEALSTYEIKEISKAKIIHYTFNDPDEEPTINLIPGSNGINSYPNIGNTWGTYYTGQYNDNTYFSIGAIVSVTNNIVTVNGSGRTIYTYDVLRPQTTGGGVTAGTDYFIKMVGVNQFTLHAYNSSQDGSQGYINPATNDHKVFDSISLDQRISINSTNFPTMW
jgi:hypothetical protein